MRLFYGFSINKGVLKYTSSKLNNWVYKIFLAEYKTPDC